MILGREEKSQKTKMNEIIWNDWIEMKIETIAAFFFELWRRLGVRGPKGGEIDVAADTMMVRVCGKWHGRIV